MTTARRTPALLPFQGARERIGAISITRPSTIAFSTHFLRAHRLEEYRFVTFYFDREYRLIAFRFLREKGPGARVMQKPKFVLARGFFRYFGIDANEVSGRYTPEKIPCKDVGIPEPGDCFVIDLKVPVARGRPQRRSSHLAA
jgi:hypothetical protein